jgi:hypothetical protein
MKKNTLQKLVQEEVHQLIQEAIMSAEHPNAEQNPSETNGELSMGSKLMQMPGHPTSGNAGTFSRNPMNNESRVALQKWVKVAKAVMAKYPDPMTIPPDMKEMLERLGQNFSQVNTPPNGGVGYGNM